MTMNIIIYHPTILNSDNRSSNYCQTSTAVASVYGRGALCLHKPFHLYHKQYHFLYYSTEYQIGL